MIRQVFTGTAFGLCMLCFALAAHGGIRGSAHDFSNAGWSEGQMCVMCHTSHGGDTSAIGGPDWNHQLSSATYVLYSSRTMDATPSQPSGVSKLCLTCNHT